MRCYDLHARQVSKEGYSFHRIERSDGELETKGYLTIGEYNPGFLAESRFRGLQTQGRNCCKQSTSAVQLLNQGTMSGIQRKIQVQTEYLRPS